MKSPYLFLIIFSFIFDTVLCKPDYAFSSKNPEKFDFSRRKFDTIAVFSCEDFYSADFTGTKFNSFANFGSKKFHLSTEFCLANFYHSSNFSNAKFDSITKFCFTKFHYSTNFNFVKFCGLANFIKAEFDSVNFSYARFNSEADFDHANFNLPADFSYTNFQSKVVFYFTKFLSSTDFYQTILPDTLVFSNTKIRLELDFTNSILDSTKKANNKFYKCQIDLTNSDINKLRINYELFNLWFPKFATYEEIISTYEKLLKKFKEDGFLNSYKLLDIEYQNYRNQHDSNILINYFHKYWWNYGYNKEWVVYWSFLLLIFFTIINAFFFNKLQQEVYEVRFPFNNYSYFSNSKKKRILKGNKISKLILRVSNSVIYTAVVFWGFKLTLDNFKEFRPLTFYIWFIYVLGLFCLAYMLNIIIVK